MNVDPHCRAAARHADRHAGGGHAPRHSGKHAPRHAGGHASL